MKNKNLKDFIDKHWLMLAPMAGVNDLVFRSLCIEQGALLTYTEMVSSKALSYKNEKTKKLLQLANNETKVVVQLFGHEPATMANEANTIESILGDRLAYIDINMGCPAKKIAKKGDGSALMTRPSLAAEIVSACNESCQSPITVKFRKGYNLGSDDCYAFAEKMQKAGASAMCVHGRYAMQFYKGEADFSVYEKIKSNSDIPVIWSGDITSFSQASDLKNNDVDAIMIGRASRGNPWIFNDKKVGVSERIKIAKKHVIEYDKINHPGLSHMRKHCMWYCAGMPGASYARNKFSTCNTLDEYIDVFNQLEERINNASSRL